MGWRLKDQLSLVPRLHSPAYTRSDKKAGEWSLETRLDQLVSPFSGCTGYTLCAGATPTGFCIPEILLTGIRAYISVLPAWYVTVNLASFPGSPPPPRALTKINGGALVKENGAFSVYFRVCTWAEPGNKAKADR